MKENTHNLLFITVVVVYFAVAMTVENDKPAQPANKNKQMDKDEIDNAELDDDSDGCCCRGMPGPPGVQGIQGIQGVQGVQGPVGTTGIAGIPGKNGQKGAKGERGQRGRKGNSAKIDTATLNKYFPHIAFSVALDHDVEQSTEYRVIKYNIQFSNTGQVYDKESGVFTSPQNGTFVIGFSGVSFHGQNILLHLLKNGQRILSAFDNSGCGCCGADVDLKEKECAGSASNVAIVTLAEGERLWVELPDNYGLHNAPYHNYATFYGYLLHAF